MTSGCHRLLRVRFQLKSSDWCVRIGVTLTGFPLLSRLIADTEELRLLANVPISVCQGGILGGNMQITEQPEPIKGLELQELAVRLVVVAVLVAVSLGLVLMI